MANGTDVNRHPASGTCRTHCGRPLTYDMPSDTDTPVRRLRTLADRLRYAREYRRLRSNQLNNLAGLASGYTSRIESGERLQPSAEHLSKIAGALGVRLQWLMQGTEPMIEAASAGVSSLPNLERCIATRPEGRWSPAILAAARTAARDRPVGEWETVLDELQATIGPTLAQKNL